MRSFFEALQFLSILPLPIARNSSASPFGALLRWFPLVGALLGGLTCLIGGLVGVVWNEGVRSVSVVLAIAALTGGLHLDGLSDTFDALLSWRSRERMLEIMRDSRIGAMGALALIFILLLKVSLIAACGNSWWSGVVAATTLGRWAMLRGIYFYPAARESGLGYSAHIGAQHAQWWPSTIQAGVITLLTAALNGIALWRAALAILLVGLCAQALAYMWARLLGGLTGDTYGALCEISEVVALAVWSAGGSG
ncbi:MAG: adenosylcobinamide-GDP ribazoletransferase [Thermoflexales bacterium]